jgi:hypothetical protein
VDQKVIAIEYVFVDSLACDATCQRIAA